eukprot:TRINITY_DN24145_c0_g1_i1.p1 TRINITY_DN24145_c0_g1~~TRINITY_DN24145_c0_g1_i1.p1  ORF type:complete len:739 (+),score=199.28 TRINITY_DN24145_c0_g1_i1:135-2351(+)
MAWRSAPPRALSGLSHRHFSAVPLEVAGGVDPPWIRVTQQGIGGTRHCQTATVAMGCTALGANVRYTVDGALPTVDSTLYVDPPGLTLSVDTHGEGVKTVRAISELGGAMSVVTEVQVELRREVMQVLHPVSVPLAVVASRLQLRHSDLEAALVEWARQQKAEILSQEPPDHISQPGEAAAVLCAGGGGTVSRVDVAAADVIVGRDVRGGRCGTPTSFRASGFPEQAMYTDDSQGIGRIPLGPAALSDASPPRPYAFSPHARSLRSNATFTTAALLSRAGQVGTPGAVALCPSSAEPGKVDVMFPVKDAGTPRSVAPPPVRIVAVLQGEDGTPYFVAEYVRPLFGWLVLLCATAGLSSKAAVADRFYPPDVPAILKSSWMTFWSAAVFALAMVWDLTAGELAGEVGQERRTQLCSFLFGRRPLSRAFEAGQEVADRPSTPLRPLHTPGASMKSRYDHASFGTFGHHLSQQRTAVMDDILAPSPRYAARATGVPAVGLLSLVALGICNCMFSCLFLAALDYTSLAQTVVFINLHPAVIALSRRHTSRIEYVGVAILVEGIVGLCVVSQGEPAPRPILGGALAFSVSLVVCVYLMLSDAVKPHCPVSFTLGTSNIVSWVAHLIVYLSSDAEATWSTDGVHGVWGIFASHWAASLSGGMLGGAVAYGGFQVALRYVSPLDVSVGMCLEPLFSVLIGTAIGLSAPPPSSWMFLAVIMTGAYIVCTFGQHDNNNKKVAVTEVQ